MGSRICPQRQRFQFGKVAQFRWDCSRQVGALEVEVSQFVQIAQVGVKLPTKIAALAAQLCDARRLACGNAVAVFRRYASLRIRADGYAFPLVNVNADAPVENRRSGIRQQGGLRRQQRIAVGDERARGCIGDLGGVRRYGGTRQRTHFRLLIRPRRDCPRGCQRLAG